MRRTRWYNPTEKAGAAKPKSTFISSQGILQGLCRCRPEAPSLSYPACLGLHLKSGGLCSPRHPCELLSEYLLPLSLTSGFWLLASGFWVLGSGFWFLVSGFWLCLRRYKLRMAFDICKSLGSLDQKMLWTTYHTVNLATQLLMSGFALLSTPQTSGVYVLARLVLSI